MRELMPPITKNLLIINILMFVAPYVLGRYGINLNSLLGLHFFMASDFRLHQIFTYLFMHGGFEHLFFNMFALWMFGRIIEQVMGPKRFLTYYMVCGIGAGLIQELVQYIHFLSLAPELSGVSHEQLADALNMWNTVGASGSIYGILLAFGMSFPEDRLFIIVREVVCPECKRTSYAVRSIKDEERDYEVIRRDELKERTGIRLIRPVLSKRGC